MLNLICSFVTKSVMKGMIIEIVIYYKKLFQYKLTETMGHTNQTRKAIIKDLVKKTGVQHEFLL